MYSPYCVGIHIGMAINFNVLAGIGVGHETVATIVMAHMVIRSFTIFKYCLNALGELIMYVRVMCSHFSPSSHV